MMIVAMIGFTVETPSYLINLVWNQMHLSYWTVKFVSSVRTPRPHLSVSILLSIIKDKLCIHRNLTASAKVDITLSL